MRLTFKVLWFENQPGEVTPAIRALRQRLEQHGFELILDMQEDDSRVDELSAQHELHHDTDLVVVDFDLGEGSAKGDTVARRIRNRFSFTDIIFYSGSKPDELRQKVKDQGIDGVYCLPRGDLRSQLLERVDDVVKRTSRLEAMRGLAVVTAGRGDEHLRNILRGIHASLDDNGKAELLGHIDGEVRATAERNQKRYDGLGNLEDRLSDFACTSMALLKAAKEFVGRRDDLKAEREILGKYQPDVIEVRNNFGHIVEEIRDDGWAIVCKKGEIKKEDFPTFRKNFSMQLKNLSSLEALVAAQSG
ncbi:MAG: hypothetical protein ACOY45_00875 [Pseudomonadota bacterium]